MMLFSLLYKVDSAVVMIESVSHAFVKVGVLDAVEEVSVVSCLSDCDVQEERAVATKATANIFFIGQDFKVFKL